MGVTCSTNEEPHLGTLLPTLLCAIYPIIQLNTLRIKRGLGFIASASQLGLQHDQRP